jgi:hypothetical protein
MVIVIVFHRKDKFNYLKKILKIRICLMNKLKHSHKVEKMKRDRWQEESQLMQKTIIYLCIEIICLFVNISPK